MVMMFMVFMFVLVPSIVTVAPASEPLFPLCLFLMTFLFLSFAMRAVFFAT